MIDLHMHSLYSSDGDFSPADLAAKCAAAGISLMSITDHNTVAATEEAITAAKQHGIRYLPGIEIDCMYENSGFHMLGYGIDYRNSDFAAIEHHVRAQDRQAAYLMLEKTQTLGFDVQESDMQALAAGRYWAETWTGEMFAEFLLEHPAYQDHPLLKPYRAGGERSSNPFVNFYWDFYAQGKPCHAPIHYPAMQKIVDIIHQNNGLAVLAHPHMNLKGKAHLLDGIIKTGIDGIEAFSSYHSPEQIQKSLNDAAQNGLFTTFGSDFHGKTKPSIQLAQHGCTWPLADMERQLDKLWEKVI
ncbi:PHP domain-containing protein [Testudinibacter aquarius]|uniref:PHP domain-containing protein n=1 Tax=Testudinibacter aquarius TaxID=1524974 RepID=A0A4R3YEE8_9PAST|nr:PHP domain-containing protein [Testudinibacter aquarius]KAE9528960.1 phosphatase [Testudinibacter aquarius]TCV89234.1 hypothetical protein EDC16_102111 [Testudinibacter aquarius]TNG93298.1 PHP domain-containing protein [Testudinibacter aquarius]